MVDDVPDVELGDDIEPLLMLPVDDVERRPWRFDILVDDDVPDDMPPEDMLPDDMLPEEPVDIEPVGLDPVVPIELEPAEPLGEDGLICADAVVATRVAAAMAINIFMMVLLE